MSNQRLGYIGLSALVFGMMVGAGIFNIPQNMAAEASLGALVLAWVITATGILFLVFTFKHLADHHPELDAGIYQYANSGFGPFAGFLVAWGYWLCTAFANIAYAVMLNDTVGAFFPSLLDHGWLTLGFCSILIWVIFFIVLSGIRIAKILTTALSLIKVVTILLIILLLAINVKAGLLTSDFWTFSTPDGVNTPSIPSQIKNSMMITLWCFIGVEGAVVMSWRARRGTDVGKAGVTGFFAAWILYVLVSVLCYGVMNRATLAGLEDPSVAYVLRDIVGDWAYWFVIISIIISLSGGWIAWTLICAEVPYSAARVGIFPRRFLRLNRHMMPTFGLFTASLIMQLFLLLVMMADEVYITALNTTGMMILPAYLVSGMYLWKISIHGNNRATKAVAIGCTIFCLWMIYAGGLDLLIDTSWYYIAGLYFYFKARATRTHSPLSSTEKIWLAILIASAITSLFI